MLRQASFECLLIGIDSICILAYTCFGLAFEGLHGTFCLEAFT